MPAKRHRRYVNRAQTSLLFHEFSKKIARIYCCQPLLQELGTFFCGWESEKAVITSGPTVPNYALVFIWHRITHKKKFVNSDFLLLFTIVNKLQRYQTSIDIYAHPQLSTNAKSPAKFEKLEGWRVPADL